MKSCLGQANKIQDYQNSYKTQRKLCNVMEARP